MTTTALCPALHSRQGERSRQRHADARRGRAQQWTTANVNSLLAVNGLFSSGASLGFDTNGGNFSLVSIGNGSLGLTVVGSHSLSLTGSSGFSGGTNVSQGTLQLDNSAALLNSTVAINTDNGLQFNRGVGTYYLGGLSGSNLLQLSDTAGGAVGLVVGGNGASTTFSGEIAGSGSLTKVGDGGLVLSGSNDYLGGTTVEAGTLYMANSNAIAAGTNLTVGAGGTLIFDPTMAPAPVNQSQSMALSPDDALSHDSAAGIAAVPEPNSLILLIAGLVVGVGAWRRRKCNADG